MLRKRGKRIVTEHGKINNVLPGLHLVDQLSVAGICNRTYTITVPWNVPRIQLPHKCAKKFIPKIDDITDDFVCKRIESTIENEVGFFYGSVSIQTEQPSGYGVFVTDEWIHCGEVLDGAFSGSGKVSMNKISTAFQIL